MARLSATILRDFTVPASDPRPSFHGSQSEDAIIEAYLPGWCRECSEAAKVAFLPNVAPVREGGGRGRGTTAIDANRVNPDRASGGDFLSIKEHSVRKDGTVATTAKLFHGTLATAVALLGDVRANYAKRKAFPVCVVITDGKVDGVPRIREWCIRDFGHMVSAFTNAEGWELLGGIPKKPLNDRARGAGGSPASVWIVRERRELHGLDKNGNPKYVYIQDDKGDYAGIYATFSKRSGAKFKSGSPQDFAADVDAATVLR